ncbi:hypothetical protein [Archangium violaceum]|uniref:hypothetical protein n=1 Tax=Archangium violaceum TaxID=83451 RepID=UPI001F3215A4|nr:hypothetical protein [Archangium violaceum]
MAGPEVWQGLVCWYGSGRSDLPALAAFGATTLPVHGLLAGNPLGLGAFLAPDGKTPGSIEHLCRLAVRNQTLSACVDALVGCAQPAHGTAALAAKGWLNAYLAMCPDPRLRFHQAFDPGVGGIDPSHPVFEPLRNFLQSL